MRLALPPKCVYSGNEVTKNHVNTIFGRECYINQLHPYKHDYILRVRYHSILYRKVTNKL